MSKSLQLSLQLHVNDVCLAFEDQWQAGNIPSITDYVRDASAVVQDSLLRELILLDVDYRKQARIPFTAEDYVAQVPDHELIVRKIFNEMHKSTDVGQESLLDTSLVGGSLHPNSTRTNTVGHVSEDQGSVGRYRLEEQVDEGSFGMVYRATDTELRREVAVKIPHRHLADGSLGLSEARTVAELDHPNILPVYDVGRTLDDRVYFVMKYLPNRDYGQQIKTGKVHPREAARQFAELADALAYAHSKGIIHRDIKPSNILLENVDKLCLVDFGLAARTKEESANGSLVGTPAYMSPEQASRGSEAITERSDIYGLGATLYHALTGQLPVDGKTNEEILHRLPTMEPPRPRQIRPSIPLDLETICLKCLEKKADDRYATAFDLADDLQRFVRNEPIRARPIGQLERAWKLAVRRPTLVGLIVLASLILLASPVVALVMNSLRMRALEQTTRAEKVTKYMVEAFRSPDPDRDGKTITVYELLNRAVTDLEGQFEGDPLLNVQFLLAIGETFKNLEIHSDAISALSEAYEHCEAQLGESHPQTLNAMQQLAAACDAFGEINRAISLFGRLAQLRRLKLGEEHPDTLTATNGLARAYFGAGNYDESLPLLERTLELRRARLGNDHVDTLTSINNLGRLHSFAGRNDAAIPLLEEALELRRVQLGPQHLHTLVTQQNLAQAYIDADRGEEGLSLLEQAFQIQRETLGKDHAATLRAKWRLAIYYTGVGRPEDGLAIMEEVWQARRDKLGEDHPGVLSLAQNLGNKYRILGQFAKSRQILQETVELAIPKLGEDHPTTLAAMNALAFALGDECDSEESALLLERVVDLGTPKLGEDNPQILGAMGNLGMVYRGMGRLDESLSVLKRAHDIAVGKLGEDHQITRMLKDHLDLTIKELGH